MAFQGVWCYAHGFWSHFPNITGLTQIEQISDIQTQKTVISSFKPPKSPLSGGL